MSKVKVEGYRLSPQQRRVWALRERGGEAASLMQCEVKLRGELDPERLRQAIGAAVRQHEILRTHFAQVTGMNVPLQVVNEEAGFAWNTRDAGGMSPEEQTALLQQVREGARERHVDYEGGATLAAWLAKQSDSEHTLVLSVPSLCADLASSENLVETIRRIYDGDDGSGRQMEETVQYADLCTWLNELIEGEDAAAGQDYWQAKLAKPAEPWRLAGEVQGQEAYLPGRTEQRWIGEDARAVTKMASRTGVSEASVLLGCWQSLLWRLSRVEQVRVGVNVTGRSYEGMAGVIGRLERQLPVIIAVSNERLLWEMLREVEQQQQEICEWQEHYNWERFETREPASAGFGFSYAERVGKWASPGLSWEIVKSSGSGERNKAWLNCVRRGEELAFELHYDRGAIEERLAQRILGQYCRLVKSATESDEATRVVELKLVANEEQRRLLEEFSGATVAHDRKRTVVEFIEEHARKNAEDIAVESGVERLSYGELEHRANQLARHLREKGVGPEQIVGICLDRSAGMIVGLLAILKAGGAYLPLDGSYPRARLDYMLSDSRVGVIVTEEKYEEQLRSQGRELVLLDRQWSAIAQGSAEPVKSKVESSNLAYVIYTSGSTGQPKGVMVQHGGLTNHMQWMQAKYGLGKRERLLQKTTLCFDASVWEWLLPLMSGGVVVLPESGMQMDSRYLVRMMQQAQITTIQVVPTMLRLLLKEEGIGQCNSLERVFVGGEALTEELVEQFDQRVGSELINLYGPTETTVQVMIWEKGWEKVVGIGCGISNVTVHVVDEELELAGIGEAGEICIGGIPLSRGYLKRPDATAERFIPNPFGAEPGARLYRTSDVGRWRDDGVLEFLGRIDDQVKIRGFRVELGEIEAALRAQVEVKDAAVVVKEETSGQRLVCYVVAEAGNQLEAKFLRQRLEQRLPEYMVPGTYVVLKSMPLTPNGKLDKRALPEPGHESADINEKYVAPRTEMEATIAGIWSELLEIKTVGVQDNFFDVGGHSLLMIQVHSKLRELLGKDVSIVELFARPTVSLLAEFLSREGGEESITDDAENRLEDRRATTSGRRQVRAAARQEMTTLDA